MLALFAKAFAERTGVVVAFPMAHADFNTDNPFANAAKGQNGEVGCVLAHQPKASWPASSKKPPLHAHPSPIVAAKPAKG